MNKLANSSQPIQSPPFNFPRFVKRRSRHGLTLIELIIAVGLTLIIIAAMIRAFKTSSESISLGRAKMDMHNKIRVVTEQLRSDLRNATHIPVPRDTYDGYFEIVEGEETDGEHATSDLSFIGDHDDILALTVRSNGEPFRGRFGGGFAESYLAEVIWWISHDDTNADDEAGYDESLRLYRRVLLIRPDLTTNTTAANIVNFYENNDISVRPDGAALAMNSLEDLADRRNRFAHNSNLAAFPHEFITTGPNSIFNRTLSGDDEGFDLMLDNCVAFDIKVFDPTAEVFVPANAGLSVGQVIDFDDPGFDDPTGTTDIVGQFPPAANPLAYPQSGAYVNLGYDAFDTTTTPPRPVFSSDRWFAAYPFENTYTFTNPTYCTWWKGYESDGVDQNMDGTIDEGSDGVDNDSANGVDDNDERETRPPYGFPIRSLEVRIRMIEKKTNQILQKTIRESFVPN